jgi:hypothetical protein
MRYVDGILSVLVNQLLNAFADLLLGLSCECLLLEKCFVLSIKFNFGFARSFSYFIFI